MSEFEDLTLREAFSQFHEEARTVAPSQDIAGVRAIARRRRNTRTAVVGVAAALVIMAPVAAFAFTGRQGGPPASVQPGGSGTPNPSASASPSTSSSAVPPAPDGKISLAELGNATLDIPAWPAGGSGRFCPTKQQKFTDGSTPAGELGFHTMILNVAYADVDHDGAKETISLLGCVAQSGDKQVVVFDRDANGGIVTFGRVVSTDNGIQEVFAVRGEADGSVNVEVGDIHVCCGTTSQMAEHQWRTYAWTGDRFQQTGGPTKFHPASPANDLSITSSVDRLEFGPVRGGMRTSSFTVTVSNKGSQQAPGLWVDISAYLTQDPTSTGGQNDSLPAPVRLSSAVSGCQDVAATTTRRAHIECHLPALAAGAFRTYTFTLSSPTANDAVLPSEANPSLREPMVWVELQEEQPGIRTLLDPNRADNALGLPAVRVA
ncbi:hypothetical protein [Planosporangium mesophilum]|uniref:DUF11 domain-containing protein n=1 Tax=Planosporangium mesophilum TaxID=689768 RepID=A0A8J3TIB4_9ACTN|nr:hypothetical protein [Planosporangium mesophilum]NJC86468.1 hypothetical protein [Planosporangium mesophilum]GII26111.1 hypothetical protein Pme01_57080 [Planosporangium mesophilum]